MKLEKKLLCVRNKDTMSVKVLRVCERKIKKKKHNII